MKISRENVNIEPEQDILTGLIMSDRFIRELHPILDISLLEVDFVRVVARWCLEYYKQYELAPRETIQDIYNNKKGEGVINPNTVELIEKFLVVLSKRFEYSGRFNERYILDQSERYLARCKLIALQEGITSCLMKGDIDKAESLVAGHMRMERASSVSVDVLDERSLADDLLYDEEDIIFRFPGALGQMVGNICKGDFLAFIGPMKRGKSFWLVDTAIRCVLSGFRVLYVSLEMPRRSVRRRIFSNLLGEPRKAGMVEVPYFDDENYVHKRSVEKSGYLNVDLRKRVDSLRVLFGEGMFRVVCYPTRSASVSTIKMEMENLIHYSKFFPDVLIVDYADIMAPEPGSLKDKRDRIDETWMALRRIAQEMNGLVVTVSQAGRSTFNKDIKEVDVAEDIRKLAHVTHMIALNQTSDNEREKYMARLSLLVGREIEFNSSNEVVVLGQKALGKAYIDSRRKVDVRGEDW